MFFSQDHAIEWYNTDNGLPQNSIKDILKDPYGFLWLSSEGGIIRYDGINFINYDKLPINSFRFDNFEKISNGKYINRNEYGLNTILISKRRIHTLPKSIVSFKKIHNDKYKVHLNIKIKDNEPLNNNSKQYLSTKNGIYFLKSNLVFFFEST